MRYKSRLLGKYIYCSLTVLCLFLLILNPQCASEAVRKALSICARIILPSLLPFFFISGIIYSLSIPEYLAVILQKPMEKLLGLNPWACTPLLLGLLGGYPVGAATLAQLRTDGKISAEEADTLLPICNNTGPSFIIGAVGGGIFSSFEAGLILYSCHILSAFALALLFSRKGSFPPMEFIEAEGINLSSALSSSIKSATEKCLGICGYVIFFSVLSSLMDELGILSFLAISINTLSGVDIGLCRSLIAGILELGGGIASMEGMAESPQSLALAAFILGFGSLSVHCQTLAVVSSAKINCARHFVGRIIHGCISATLVFLIANIFII